MSKGKAPRSKHIATFFTVVGASNEPLTCAVFETDTGFELRLSYSDGYGMQSESFPEGEGRAERIAATADQWRRAWLDKGFREVGA